MLLPFAAVVNLESAFAEEESVDQCLGASNPDNECFFLPKEVTIKEGDKVIWNNSDSATHTITSGVVDDPKTWGEIFDSGLVKPAEPFEFTFEAVGEYPYLCQLHPWMVSATNAARSSTSTSPAIRATSGQPTRSSKRSRRRLRAEVPAPRPRFDLRTLVPSHDEEPRY